MAPAPAAAHLLVLLATAAAPLGAGQQDALAAQLGTLHFDNGGELRPVRSGQQFVHLPQCSMCWELDNISTTLWAWTGQWFSPMDYLYDAEASNSTAAQASLPLPCRYTAMNRTALDVPLGENKTDVTFATLLQAKLDENA